MPVKLPAQEIVVGLAVNGLQEGREMHTPRGKMQGKILGLRPSPLHKLRAGVVKGAVSVAIAALPAIGAQHAPAANFLGRPVKITAGFSGGRGCCPRKKLS